MILLELKFCIFDELDFGFDVDVFQVVVDGVNSQCDGECSFIVVIYYQCFLDYIKFDFVYIFVDGKIVKSGDVLFVLEVEKSGYVFFGKVYEEVEV